MSNWTSVSTLDVMIETGARQCEIYANGLNMIGVVVSIQPTDDQGNPVTVDITTLRKNTKLIDYVTESPLNWEGSSDWCYTDTPNEFHMIPAMGQLSEAQINNEGIPQLTFYVYCSAGASTKSIGVQVQTSSGSIIRSSQHGMYSNYVQVGRLVSPTYKKADVYWNNERAQTHEYDESMVYNYYLSCKNSGFYFKKFSVSGYCHDSGYEGAIGWIVGANYGKDFYGAYVWYQEPHRQARETIINFPGDWSDQVTVYDKSNNDQILCFTWAWNRHGGSGHWKIPTGPMTYWWQYYDPSVVIVYDQYGNSGKFRVDARNINPNYASVEAETTTETIHGRSNVQADPRIAEANPAGDDPPPTGPKLDIYD